MVELQHRAVPTPALTTYASQVPAPTVAGFDSLAFKPIKGQVKADLNADQAGLCVYCEAELAPDKGQVEHLIPKGGPQAQPGLCYTYTNLAHSCISPKTCGQKKRHGILPIPPAPGCNSQWTLSTDGTIEPIAGLTRAQRHKVVQTRDMLGLNQDASLVADRQQWLKGLLAIAVANPADVPAFLRHAPYRYILNTL